jgi:hypothetical protein
LRHPKAVERLLLVNPVDGQFTARLPEPFILAHCRDAVAVQIRFSELKSGDEIRLTKWKLLHPAPVHFAVANSRLSAPVFTGTNRSPALFIVGKKPFLSVASIAPPPEELQLVRTVKHAAKWLWSYFSESGPPEEAIPVHDAIEEWTLFDRGRLARTVMASEDARWMATADAKGRVTIVDAVFGHMTKVLKGMRDAQSAWADRETLLVYAPARAMILSCAVPGGEVVDAVKVDGDGKLFQRVTADGRMQAMFVDSKGFVISVSVSGPESPPGDRERPPAATAHQS